jgi:hypothetical protein
MSGPTATRNAGGKDRRRRRLRFFQKMDLFSPVARRNRGKYVEKTLAAEARAHFGANTPNFPPLPKKV